MKVSDLQVLLNENLQAAQPTRIIAKQPYLAKVGDRVWAQWSSGAMYVGTIQEFQGDKAYIRFDDGDCLWANADETLPYEATIGMRVRCKWGFFRKLHRGVITKIDGDRLQVRFDDGAEGWTTPAALVFLCDVRNPDVTLRWHDC